MYGQKHQSPKLLLNLRHQGSESESECLPLQSSAHTEVGTKRREGRGLGGLAVNRRTRRTSSELVDLEGTWRKLGGYYGETRREREENYIGGELLRNRDETRRDLGGI